MNPVEIPIVYQDDELLIIDKPSGISVHRNPQARHETSVQHQLIKQTGIKYHPVHRIDRATSGVLIMTADTKIVSLISKQFEEKKIAKKYLAILRGFTPESGTIERPLKNHDNGNIRESQTDFKCLAQKEFPHPVKPFPTSRYSLVEAIPVTGRTHQLRRHFNGIGHPILGDTSYGSGLHNQAVRQHFDCQRLLLHALSIAFFHPKSGERLYFEGAIPPEFIRIFPEYFAESDS